MRQKSENQNNFFLATQTPAQITISSSSTDNPSEALDFVQRMSTNNILKYANEKFGDPFFNCFVNNKARIIALVEQTNMSQNEIILKIEPEHADKLVKFLDDFIFAEDITLAVIPYANQSSEAGLALSAESTQFEQHRINNIIPKANFEICEKYNPLELGLEDFVAFNKGCYIGQEVLARLNTYDKVKKKLSGVEVNNLEEFKNLKNNSNFPHITSIAPSFVENQIYALQVAKI